MKRWIAGAGIVLGSFGCELPAPSELASSQDAIVSGTLDTVPEHIAVVSLSTPGGFSFCSGTYIGNRTILSAAHCVDSNSNDTGLTLIEPEEVVIYFGSNPSQDRNICPNGNSTNNPTNNAVCNRFVLVEDIDTFGYNPNTLKRDASVLKLVAEPVLNGQPVVPMRFASTIEGTELTAADVDLPISYSGFGVTDGVTETGGGIKRIANEDYRPFPQGISLTTVGPGPAGVFGSITSDQIFAEKPDNNMGSCRGDSGGPVLLRRNGVEFVIGMNSFGDQNCDFGSVAARADAFSEEICAFAGAAALGCGGNPLVPELCTNGIDDDGDSLADCEDPQCATDLACRELCGNGVDDNNDGEIDCGDPECATSALCAEDCDNGTDDDSDGDLDCEDSDCVGNAACVENCTNGSDDDGDGAVDCDDVVDCSSNAACQVAQELCKNFADDDGDGAVDCDDSDCADFEDCQAAPPAEEGCAVAPSSNSAPGALLFLFFLSVAFLSRRRLF